MPRPPLPPPQPPPPPNIRCSYTQAILQSRKKYDITSYKSYRLVYCFIFAVFATSAIKLFPYEENALRGFIYAVISIVSFVSVLYLSRKISTMKKELVVEDIVLS